MPRPITSPPPAIPPPAVAPNHWISAANSLVFYKVRHWEAIFSGIHFERRSAVTRHTSRDPLEAHQTLRCEKTTRLEPFEGLLFPPPHEVIYGFITAPSAALTAERTERETGVFLKVMDALKGEPPPSEGAAASGACPPPTQTCSTFVPLRSGSVGRPLGGCSCFSALRSIWLPWGRSGAASAAAGGTWVGGRKENNGGK